MYIMYLCVYRQLILNGMHSIYIEIKSKSDMIPEDSQYLLCLVTFIMILFAFHLINT